jgi:transcription elongation GreA/GreB family factor
MKKILEEDLVLLDERIKILEKQMLDLGEDFNEAVSQSSETWHDNAPFDAVRDRQSLIQFELTRLRNIRKETTKIKPIFNHKIQIGSKVTLKASKRIRVMIGGNWVGRSDVEGHTLISCESPIAVNLLGRRVGEQIDLSLGKSIIEAIV